MSAQSMDNEEFWNDMRAGIAVSFSQGGMTKLARDRMLDEIDRRENESRPTHRHVKSGNEYRLIGQGKLQTDVPLTDYADLVAYVDKDGDLWFRPPSEFHDGRFESVQEPQS